MGDVGKVGCMLVLVFVVMASYCISELSIMKLCKKYRKSEFFIRICGMTVELSILCILVIYLLWVDGRVVIDFLNISADKEKRGVQVERMLSDEDGIVLEKERFEIFDDSGIEIIVIE